MRKQRCPDSSGPAPSLIVPLINSLERFLSTEAGVWYNRCKQMWAFAPRSDQDVWMRFFFCVCFPSTSLEIFFFILYCLKFFSPFKCAPLIYSSLFVPSPLKVSFSPSLPPSLFLLSLLLSFCFQWALFISFSPCSGFLLPPPRSLCCFLCGTGISHEKVFCSECICLGAAI